MRREDVLERLKGCEQELRGLGLKALYLFGSVARAERNSEDIDLLFEVGDARGFSLLSQASAALRLEEILGSPVDLVERGSLHPRIRPRVEADLVRIY